MADQGGRKLGKGRNTAKNHIRKEVLDVYDHPFSGMWHIEEKVAPINVPKTNICTMIT